MPIPQTETNTTSKVGTKVAGAVLIVAGLGILGFAAGAMPNIGKQKTVELSGVINNDGASVTNVGDALPYVVKVKNSGNSVATDVTVATRIANGSLSYISAVGTYGFTCSLVSSNVTCTGGEIPAGATAAIKIETTLAANLLACNKTGTISGMLTIDPDNTILESNESDNTGLTANSLLGPCTQENTDLSITKAGSLPSVKENDMLAYTISVKNNGSTTATAVKVTDTLSSDVWAYQTGTGTNGFTCTASGKVVTCTGGTISAGDTATITVIGKIGVTRLECEQSSVLSDTAKVDPSNTIAEFDEANNSVTVTTLLTNPCGGTTTTTVPSGGSGSVSTGTTTTGTSMNLR